MKKYHLIVLILSFALLLTGCSTNKKMSGMPQYKTRECYYSEGFQDYTDYCKYFYDETSIREFETHKKFKQVMDSDVQNIKNYFENFDEWVKNQSYYEKYDFDYQLQIKEGDYFYILTKEGTKTGDVVYGKFDSYDVYYVDMQKCILYYVHSNI